MYAEVYASAQRVSVIFRAVFARLAPIPAVVRARISALGCVPPPGTPLIRTNAVLSIVVHELPIGPTAA